MDALVEARDEIGRGRFTLAASRLRGVEGQRFGIPGLLLKASISEAVGDYEIADDLARRALRSKLLTDAERSSAEFTLSRVAAAAGIRRAEFDHLQRSLAAAEKAGHLGLIGWAEIRLLALMDSDSESRCATFIHRVRRTVSCAGDPALSAAMHLVAADLDGKRGLLGKSQRHVALARSILSRYPNTWLQAWSENTLLALALSQCDLPAAVDHGNLALELGTESGSAIVIRHAHANLGRLYYTMGAFDRALESLQCALKMATPKTEAAFAIVDSIAEVRLAQGQLEEADASTAWVDSIAHDDISARAYVFRHSLVTRAEVLKRLGRGVEAKASYKAAREFAELAGDKILQSRVTFGDSAAGSDAQRAAPSRDATGGCATPDQAIDYEYALMRQLMVFGQFADARRHYDRAVMLAGTVSNKPAVKRVTECWSQNAPATAQLTSGTSSVSNNLQDIASLLLHAGRPELMASTLLTILRTTDSVAGARALARASDGTENEIGTCGTPVDPANVRIFALGMSRGCAIELQIQPLSDVESHATVNSIGFIIAATLELERGRIEREERQTLWPIDELPAADDDSVVAGQMRDVMLYARKVAQANVTVLITGESGTGKEVLARAVHRYSPRSKKPFIPFNCTAVPRELLESHLFGFKRGSFTGADRDNQGLIRAAKDGTLFLDEIGELGLDLQPKLLRFLESGEIHPLGEPAPIRINVRIVAATNADLQKLVAEGRFREDLYYRLNVIPIALPPLRERRDEIAPLAQHFALKWSHELGKGCMRVADDLMAHLVLYPWPGNVRQLSNEIHRMVAFAEAGAPLTLDHLPKVLRAETELLKRRANGLEMAVALDDRLDRAIASVEREMIKVALRSSNGKVDPAAKSLGLSRKGLYLKRQRFGL